MNIDLNNLFKLSKEERKAIAEYLDKVLTLEEEVMILTGGFGKIFNEEAKTGLRNIDLWIDAHIKKRPYLNAFRLHVRKKMNELSIEPWPDYVYQTANHFKS